MQFNLPDKIPRCGEINISNDNLVCSDLELPPFGKAKGLGFTLVPEDVPPTRKRRLPDSGILTEPVQAGPHFILGCMDNVNLSSHYPYTQKHNQNAGAIIRDHPSPPGDAPSKQRFGEARHEGPPQRDLLLVRLQVGHAST